MNPAKPKHPFVLHALAAALCSIGAAQAAEIPTGNTDLRIRFDNTVKYNFGYRVNG